MSLTLEEYEKLDPRCTVEMFGQRILYATPSRFTKWRVDSLLTKEPCTIEWIAGFQPDDRLVDIGANVGMYTVLAAAGRGCRVWAFEPESQNFALLNRNIYANRLNDRVAAFCLALSDAAGLSALHLSDLAWGGSCHSLGERVDHNLQPREPEFSQGCIAMPLDDLVAQNTVPVPTRIKIDVDGFEHKVVAGARQTLQRPELRSVLIEINPGIPEHHGIIRDMQGFGFTYDPQQVKRVERQEGRFKGCAEYVFSR
jgi:FkbM family methyltransferase